MNELVWEGLIEILREGQPSLTATARLWRRDDVLSADWGGQLELPVVFRRLLPPGDYTVRLPSGNQAGVRITSGPSTTSTTFPTLTGFGQPPFGTPAPQPDTDAEADIDIDSEATLETTLEAAPPVGSTAAPLPNRKAAHAVAQAGAKAAEKASEPAPVAAALAAASPPVVAAPTEPTPAASVAVAAADASPRRKRGTANPAPAPMVESADQTAAMARAFLAAVEARKQLQTVTRPGFEGRAIEAARDDVDAVTSTLEGALRARTGADHWPQALREHLVALRWFASLAISDDETEIVGAGRVAQALVGTIEALLQPSMAHLRAA